MGLIEDFASNHSPAYWIVAGVIGALLLYYFLFYDEEERDPHFVDTFYTVHARFAVKTVLSFILAVYWWPFSTIWFVFLVVMYIIDRTMHRFGWAQESYRGILYDRRRARAR